MLQKVTQDQVASQGLISYLRSRCNKCGDSINRRLYGPIPVVCISGQVPTHLVELMHFECDTTGITRPCTKHNWLVKNVNDLAEIMNQAFKITTMTTQDLF